MCSLAAYPSEVWQRPAGPEPSTVLSESEEVDYFSAV